MTFDNAIKILSLNRNFTEEELKQAYRKLAQIHHPDRHENSKDRVQEEEIMKDINAAKEYLMKYLKENKHQNTAYSNINIIEYRKTKLQELQRIVSQDFVAEFASKLDDLSVDINTIFYELNDMPIDFYTKTHGIYIKVTIDALYKEYLNKIKNKFKELEMYFYKENYINKEDIKENINYDCTLKEFCDQLLKFKDKYSKEAILNKKLEEELLKYTYFAGYEIIETQIKDVIRNFTSKIKNQKFKYTQQDIDAVNKEITELFNKFFSLKKKIETLEKTIKTINNKEIQEQFELIKNNLYSGYSFTGFDDEISELEEKIEEYIKETILKNKFKENEQTINEIYKKMIARYSEILQSYNITTTLDTIYELNDNLNEIIGLFQQGCSKYKDLDFFNLFNDITFNNTFNDKKIKHKIKNMMKDKKSTVYIKANIEGIWDECSFFWYDEENMTMYRIRNAGTIDSEKITYQQLTDNYITLEDFLDEATFVGQYKMKRNTDVIGIIYEGFGYSIYLEKNKFCITKDTSPMKTIRSRTTESFNKYRDKQYVYDMIEEQLREVLEKHKKKSTPTGYEHYMDYIIKNNNKIFGKREYNYSEKPGIKRKRK